MRKRIKGLLRTGGLAAQRRIKGCRRTNLIDTLRAIQDQRDDQFALGLGVTCDVTWVCLYVWNEFGGLLEERVSANTAWLGGRNANELASGLSTERAEEEGVWDARGMIRWGIVTRMRKV